MKSYISPELVQLWLLARLAWVSYGPHAQASIEQDVSATYALLLVEWAVQVHAHGFFLPRKSVWDVLYSDGPPPLILSVNKKKWFIKTWNRQYEIIQI